jgi:hypothetical protein
MKVPTLALSVVIGASLLIPAPPARAGAISNLLGTAAEAVQPGTGGVVRSGWGLLRGVGRAVIPRRRRSRSAGRSAVPAEVPAAAAPAAAAQPVKNTASTFSRPGQTETETEPVQAVAADPRPSQPAATGDSSLSVADLLIDPPAPPRTSAASGLIERP